MQIYRCSGALWKRYGGFVVTPRSVPRCFVSRLDTELYRRNIIDRLAVEASMKREFQYVQVSASNREPSEDLAEVFERGDSLVLVLADGASGISGGVLASRTLVTAVRSAVKDVAFDVTDVQAWADLLRATDAALVKGAGGETTGIVVVLTANKLVGVSAGDCEAWAIHAKDVVDLTVGQNTHRRLGSGRAVPVTFEHAVLEGVLLVASDGLFRYASIQVIARVVRAGPIRVAAEQLIELVRLPSGKFHDDIAAILVAQKPAPPLSETTR